MNWKRTKCCGTCALWDIDEARTKSGAVSAVKVALCLWESAEPLPDSVNRGRLQAGWSVRDLGVGCPCYIKREAA